MDKLFYKHTKLKYIVDTINLEKPYIPHTIMIPGVANTILPYLFSKKPKISFETETIHISEKLSSTKCSPKTIPEGEIALEFIRCTDSTEVILIIPGLTGTSDNYYSLLSAEFFNQQNYNVCIFNFRGSKKVKKLNNFTYNMGFTDDFTVVINRLSNEFTKIHAIGFSLGGSLLAKYLGETEANCKITTAYCVGTVIDFNTTLKNLSEKKKRILLDKALTQHLQKKNNIENRLDSLYKILKYKSIVEAEYSNVYEFNNDASPMTYVEKIKIPTVFINAKNDVLNTIDKHIIDHFKINSNVILLVTQYGGHDVLYTDSSNESWVCKLILSILRS
jgi:predicted alpha/beta-fold hydrolase